MQTPTFNYEWQFQRHVETLADELGWELRHVPSVAYEAAKYAGSYIPAGYPDLDLTYYKEGQDKPIILLAELKMNDPAKSKLRAEQEDYLKRYAHTIPCFLWRPKNLKWIESILKYGPSEPTGDIIEEENSPPLSTELLIPDADKQAVIKNTKSGSREQRELPGGLEDLSLQDVQSIVNSFILTIRRTSFSPGNLAELRRMNPDSPGTASAYWRLMADENLLGNPISERKWALILHGIALMTPRASDANRNRTAHDENIPVGRALFRGGEDSGRDSGFYSESRLNRLLTAQGPILRTLLARMFRMLAAANQSFDWHEMAWLILNEDDEERFEMARRRIASEYYQAERRSAQTETE